MSRTLGLMAAAVLMAAGCAGESAAPDSTTAGSTTSSTPATTTTAPTTTIAPAEPVTTSTTPPTTSDTPDIPVGAPVGAPVGGYLVVDRLGVHRVDRTGDTSLLVSGAVDWAADDGAGGVIYRPPTDDATIRWLPAGQQTPLDTGIVRGLAGTTPSGPAIVTTADAPGAEQCGDVVSDGEVHAINVRRLDAASGIGGPELLACEAEGADDWYEPQSYRDGRLLQVHAEAAAWIYHDRELVLHDPSGDLLGLPETSFGRPTGWFEQPRELQALLSSDGTRLAVRQRLDNHYSNGPDPETGDIDEEEWERLTASIPSTIRVVEIADGQILYETQVPYGVELGDFDGRYLVTHAESASVVVDTQGAMAPTRVVGLVVLVRADDGTTDATWPTTEPATIRQGDTGPLVSHLQLRLRYHRAVTGLTGDGPYVDGIFGPGTEAAAISFQRLNGLTPDGIVGPATWAVLLAEPREVLPILHAGGIATIGRDTPAASARNTLIDLLGPPDRDEPVDLSLECVEGADWVECAAVHVVAGGQILSWDDLGLDVLLTDQRPDDPTATAALHFGRWRLRSVIESRSGAVLAATSGVRIGSTFTEVRQAHPNVGLYLNEGMLDTFGATEVGGELVGRVGISWEDQAQAIEEARRDRGVELDLTGPTPFPAAVVLKVLGSTLDDAVVVELLST